MSSKRPEESDMSPDLMADTQAIIEHLTTGKPLDPETYHRIRERGEHLTEEIRQKHGVIDMAVDLIREGREEE